MSGGKFGYAQHKIQDIIDDLEVIVEKNGKPKTEDEIKSELMPKWYYQEYPEEKYHTEHDPEVIEEFEKGIKALKVAYVYAERIDYYLSGDDGEDSFLVRLKEELDNLK